MVLGWNLGRCMQRSFHRKAVISFLKGELSDFKYEKFYIQFSRFVYFCCYLSTAIDRVFMLIHFVVCDQLILSK